MVEREFEAGFDRLTNTIDGTSVTICRLGCEVVSYKVFDKKNGKLLPILWNDGNMALPFEGAWKNHATILFPIVGGLRNGSSTTTDGMKINLNGNHGFARKTKFELINTDTTDSAKAIYSIKASADTLEAYPYNFELTLSYELKDKALKLTFIIHNHDKKAMPCQFGWHPGINTDMGLGGKRADWTLSLCDGEYRKYAVLDTGDSFLTGERNEEKLNGPIPISDDALYNTIMYEIDAPANRRVRAFNKKLDRGIDFVFYDFPFVGFWANRAQDYLCIEPWQGLDDHYQQEPFDKKVGILQIPSGETIIRSATMIPVL